jgi:hypothetical protein
MKKRLLGLTMVASLALTSMAQASGLFRDIDNYWSKSTVEWGVSQNIVHGYPDGTFKPDYMVTDAEFLSLLIRAYNPPSFVVKPGGLWSDSFYDFAQSMNYPVNPNRDASITRSDVAEIVAGSQGQNLDGSEAIKWLLVNGIAKGKTSQTVEGFQGNDPLTRAEAVQFIKNIKDAGMAVAKSRPLSPTDTKTLDQTYQELIQNQSKTYNHVQIEDNSNDMHLLPADPTTQPAVEAFLNSLKIEGNKVTGVVPHIPDGYTLILTYNDTSNGTQKIGIPENDRDFSALPAGSSFEASYVRLGGFLMFDIYQNGHGKNSVRVNVPSLLAKLGAKMQ